MITIYEGGTDENDRVSSLENIHILLNKNYIIDLISTVLNIYTLHNRQASENE